MSRAAVLSVLTFALAAPSFGSPGDTGELVLELRNAKGVMLVGAVRRWDADGNPLKAVDAKAVIDRPALTAKATRRGDTWVFGALAPGRYDLIILTGDRVRVEGFHYPPVVEFDPFLSADAKEPEREARAAVLQAVAALRTHENKVAALYLAGDDKQVRVLMQLVRDRPTSYDGEAGYPVATIRHEVWQYTYRYGTWSREKATKILDRLLLPEAELRRWTWVWAPRLGGIEVRGGNTVRVVYDFPRRFDAGAARGWYPMP
jgi:hypothetical protein